MEQIFIPPSEQAYPETIRSIRQALEAMAVTGTLTAPDGTVLHYVIYPGQDARGVLVLVHGFTEFYRKYDETVWFFRSLGYTVVAYDQRGHGLSDRAVEPLQLVHVDRFDDYAADLKLLMDRVVLPLAGDLPVDLFSHSMGGAVCLLYLAQRPCPVRKAIFSAPMICPNGGGLPRRLVLCSAFLQGILRGWKKKYSHMQDYRPDADFAGSSSTSKARFLRHLAVREENPRYRMGPATNRWIFEAYRLAPRLLSKKAAGRIDADCLLLSAELDRVVKPRLQRKLARRLPRCRLVVLKGAKHTIYDASDPVRSEYYQRILTFLY